MFFRQNLIRFEFSLIEKSAKQRSQQANDRPTYSTNVNKAKNCAMKFQTIHFFYTYVFYSLRCFFFRLSFSLFRCCYPKIKGNVTTIWPLAKKIMRKIFNKNENANSKVIWSPELVCFFFLSFSFFCCCSLIAVLHLSSWGHLCAKQTAARERERARIDNDETTTSGDSILLKYKTISFCASIKVVSIRSYGEYSIQFFFLHTLAVLLLLPYIVCSPLNDYFLIFFCYSWLCVYVYASECVFFFVLLKVPVLTRCS